MINNKASFPTDLHRETAGLIEDFFSSISVVDTFLVVNSCARGQAVPESDLDFAVLVNAGASLSDIKGLEEMWHAFSQTNAQILQYKRSHRFAQVHLDIIDGKFLSSVWDDGGGPDYFEIEVGNRIAYSAIPGKPGLYFQQLQRQWLPYYNEDVRLQRFKMARSACEYDLDHIPFFLKRGLYFQAFDRLYKAFQEFLQALFIRHRSYPLAYNKWIKEQVETLLDLPELYGHLPALISISDIEGDEVNEKAKALQSLLDEYCTA